MKLSKLCFLWILSGFQCTFYLYVYNCIFTVNNWSRWFIKISWAFLLYKVGCFCLWTMWEHIVITGEWSENRSRQDSALIWLVIKPLVTQVWEVSIFIFLLKRKWKFLFRIAAKCFLLLLLVLELTSTLMLLLEVTYLSIWYYRLFFMCSSNNNSRFTTMCLVIRAIRIVVAIVTYFCARFISKVYFLNEHFINLKIISKYKKCFDLFYVLRQALVLLNYSDLFNKSAVDCKTELLDSFDFVFHFFVCLKNHIFLFFPVMVEMLSKLNTDCL